MRCCVYCRGGAWSAAAAQALQTFAERWHLPVANAFRFQDTFDNHHPLYPGDVGLAINPALARRVRESDLPHDRDVVVYCRVGPRGERAVELLAAEGFTRVRNLKGGLAAWRDAIDGSATVA